MGRVGGKGEMKFVIDPKTRTCVCVIIITLYTEMLHLIFL